MSRQGALWVIAALLGLVFTAAITWATAQLTSQHIGLSSEPLSAAGGLAPRVARRPKSAQQAPAARHRTPTKTGSTHSKNSTSVSSVPATVTSSTPTGGVPSAREPAPSSGEAGATEAAPTGSSPAVRSAPRTSSTGGASTQAPRTRRSSGDDGGGDGREAQSREGSSGRDD